MLARESGVTEHKRIVNTDVEASFFSFIFLFNNKKHFFFSSSSMDASGGSPEETKNEMMR
jgi:hypothetical protein